jgi:hypothetical protein
VSLALSVLAIGILALSGPPHSEAGTGTCPKSGNRTLASNGVVVVLREPKTSGGGAFACTLRTGNFVHLDAPAEGSVAFPRPALALAGYKLAYAVDTLTNENDASTRVYVIDTRKPDFEAQAEGSRVSTQSKVGSLVLSPSGATAWISCDVEQEGNGRIGRRCARPGALDRVFRLGAGSSKPRLLAKGRKIDPASLKRRGNRISWSDGGRTKTASLEYAST